MKGKRIIIVVLLLACAGVGYYYYLSNQKTDTTEPATKVSELDELLNKNIETNYPSTPRELMKLYNRYLLCLYNEDTTDQEFQKMAEQMRTLYDEELQKNNPEEAYISALKQEVESYKNDSKVIIQANVCDSDEVEYENIKGADGAVATSSYFVKEGSSTFTRTYQQFLMRKDDDGKWRILGFQKTEGDTTE